MDDDKNKKMTKHREIERQRRQEMTSLHADLRSQIPLEYIKGKRSISDHIDCAVNYINQLKITVSELNAKRDNLMRMPNSSHTSSDFIVSSCLAVNSCMVGVEILLSGTRSDGHGLPLSIILRFLLEKELDLLSCVTTKVSDDGFLHTIQAEVPRDICLDFADLKQNLDESILSWQ